MIDRRISKLAMSALLWLQSLYAGLRQMLDGSNRVIGVAEHNGPNSFQGQSECCNFSAKVRAIVHLGSPSSVFGNTTIADRGGAASLSTEGGMA